MRATPRPSDQPVSCCCCCLMDSQVFGTFFLLGLIFFWQVLDDSLQRASGQKATRLDLLGTSSSRHTARYACRGWLCRRATRCGPPGDRPPRANPSCSSLGLPVSRPLCVPLPDRSPVSPKTRNAEVTLGTGGATMRSAPPEGQPGDSDGHARRPPPTASHSQVTDGLGHRHW